jgi:hypothetical protein
LTVNVRQVIPRDAIPSVDDPTFGTSYFGAPDDRVIVYDPDDGPPRAYPTRILDYHEIVNDEADRPIAVTWCPLCGSAVVYDRQVDGRTLSFGVSGKLADDDLVMYDRETESEWKQSLGTAIVGPLDGTELTVLPAPTMTYAAFSETYDGVVLQRPGGESEAAGDGDEPVQITYDETPYRDYERDEGFGLGAHRGTGGREWDRDDIDPKTVVVGLEIDGDALGVPLPTVEDAGGALTVTAGGSDITVFATDDGLHAFENPGHAFEPVGDGRRFRADGTVWDGATGAADDGRQLRRTPAKRLFAFAWQDDHGAEAFSHVQ